MDIIIGVIVYLLGTLFIVPTIVIAWCKMLLARRPRYRRGISSTKIPA